MEVLDPGLQQPVKWLGNYRRNTPNLGLGPRVGIAYACMDGEVTATLTNCAASAPYRCLRST